MGSLLNFPLLVFLVSFVVMWGAAQIGSQYLSRKRQIGEEERSDFNFVIGATLTLLGLIIAFSFSMAVGRYDQRKNYEEEEANAIGTEYLRVELLPVAEAEKLQALVRRYLNLRIRFYEVRNEGQLRQINTETAQLQSQMWSETKANAVVQPTPLAALVASGMNDVLNRQGYTQAAWWNRIPVSAWGMMVAIAICANALMGYSARNPKAEYKLLLVLPLIVSIAFLLIADIDSPRGGLIRVIPQNLLSLYQSLHVQ